MRLHTVGATADFSVRHRVRRIQEKIRMSGFAAVSLMAVSRVLDTEHATVFWRLPANAFGGRQGPVVGSPGWRQRAFSLLKSAFRDHRNGDQL